MRWLPIVLLLTACGIGSTPNTASGTCGRPPPTTPPPGTFGALASGKYSFTPDGFPSLRGTLTITVADSGLSGSLAPGDPRDPHRSMTGLIDAGLARLDLVGDNPANGFVTPWRVIGRVTGAGAIEGTLGFGESCPSDHVAITPLP